MNMGAYQSSRLSKKMALRQISVGKVVSFEKDDCYYNVLVDEIDTRRSSFEGVILNSSSAYSDAAYPDSIVPAVHRMNVKLKDIDLSAFECRDSEPSEANYVQNANISQSAYMNAYGKNADKKHHYDGLKFVIHEVRSDYSNSQTSKFPSEPGVYCDVDVRNFIELQEDGDFRNPYVIDRTFNADNLNDMQAFYKRYASAQGCVLPDTELAYEITYCKDGKLNTLLHRQRYDRFSVDKLKEMVPENIHSILDDSFKFMKSHEFDATGQGEQKQLPSEFDNIKGNDGVDKTHNGLE